MSIVSRELRGEGLPVRALELVRLAPGRLGLPAADPSALRTSLANLGVGDAAQHPTTASTHEDGSGTGVGASVAIVKG